MKRPSTLLTTTILLLTISPAATYTCTANNAIDPSSPAPVGGGTSVPSSHISSDCPYRLQPNAGSLCLQWQTNVLANQGSNLLAGSVKRAASQLQLQGRAASSLECAETEICMLFHAGVFLCIDGLTSEFRDNMGGRGNIRNETYVMANGQTTKLASTATSLPTPGGGSGSKGHSVVVASGASATATATATGAGSGSLGSGAASLAVRLDAWVYLGLHLAAAFGAVVAVI
jgi:hypothetical protein